MFRSIIKMSLRALKRQKAYVVINVLGLSIGIVCSLLIFIFILNETSYDNYHEHRDHIHKVILEGRIGGQDIKAHSTASPIGPAMVDDFPEVEAFLRMNEWPETIVKKEDQFFSEHFFVEADSTFFEFFSIPLLRGTKEKVLNEPHTVVLSESAAQRIFGREDPIDRMLKVGTGETLYRVTGIMQDIPENTHFEAGMVGSFITNPRSRDRNWTSNSFHTYVLLHPDADPETVDQRFLDFVIHHIGPEITEYVGLSMEDFFALGNVYNFFLQPLRRIHLDPGISNGLKAPADPRYLWIFGTIGLLIVCIASINFMNLSAAQATKRAKEVGIKKVNGSSRAMLVRQFLTETILLVFIALLLAIGITELSIPFFNDLLGLNLQLNLFGQWFILPALLAFSLLLGLLAGSYPAFYLSSFQPISVLKGTTHSIRGNMGVRRMLTVLQFSISILLLVGILIMQKQLTYMINKDLGFEKENIMVIRRAEALRGQVNTFKEELKQIPGVLSVSASTAVPGRNNNNNGYTMPGRPEESFLMQTNWVDYDFLETFGMELSSGRFFDPEYGTDPEACLINDRAARNFMIDEPLQARFSGGSMHTDGVSILPVIGTIKDFHFESLREEIRPYILRFRDEGVQWGYVSIRLAANPPSGVLESIEQVWSSFTNREPMLHFLMDQDFVRMYREEKQSARLAMLFTLLAMIVASLGLYGLTAFSLQQRTREIGVRKTFGASVATIWYLFTKEIIILVGIATAIAWPLIYWIGSNWLQNFHYRINLGIFEFLTGSAIALLIALTTISYRTIKAASVNPSMSLRYE